MLKRALLMMAGVGVLFAAPDPLAAQDAWDVPSFQPPRPVHELGAYLIVPDRDDLGIMALWRQPGGLNLGVRAGLLIDRDSDRSTKYGGLVGVDVQGPLRRYGPQFPVDLSWTAGVGGTFNSTDEVRIPIGVSAGRRVDFDTVVLYPYVHPRVGIDIELDAGDDDTDTRFGFTTDVGLDLVLRQQVMLRLAASLLDRTGFGVGLAWSPGPAAAAR